MFWQLNGKYFIYATTIFFSAFLLFAIQPMVGKYLLPFFGGSSSVWATSLLFFTGMLFAGYVYVFLVTSLKPSWQVRIHAALLALAALATLATLLVWGSIYPPYDWAGISTTLPALTVLVALTLSIGASYFLLSTTGPLLQYWYGTESHHEPYKLYALSNAGSLLSLASYPFLIEPFTSLPVQEMVWVSLFFVYVCIAATIVFLYSRLPHAHTGTGTGYGTLARRTAFIWIALAALPSFLLVATTTVITQLVAPVPLLWIAPLSLFLITFILAFRGIGQSTLLPVFVLIAAGYAYRYTPGNPHELPSQILAYLALLFCTGLFCHARLFALRPATAKLPLFYLLLALGGMVGAFLASIISPLVFNDFSEFPIGLSLAAALAGGLLSFPRVMGSQATLFIRVLLVTIVLALSTAFLHTMSDSTVMASRNFYGTVKVVFTGDATTLMHGTTPHGLQPTNPEWSLLPTTYYVSKSGVGRAVLYEQELRSKIGIQVGVIGLGTGTLAGYCRTNDKYVFYEIDPRIADIARTHFSYLEHCESADVRVGDGRLLLENELHSGRAGQYDLLVADAFTDDSIPAHLLTLQAVELYKKHLRSPQSIIAIHTSNRYLELPPVLLRIANELGMSAEVVVLTGSAEPFAKNSEWVLLAEDPTVFDAREFKNIASWESPEKEAPLWTDNFTSLFTVINISPWR